MGLIARLLDLHRVPTSEVETLRRKVRRKERLAAAAKRHAATIATIMMVVGTFWVLALPFEQLGEGTKLDEHALQPGQANTYYAWDSVRNADLYLEKLTHWAAFGAPFERFADQVRDEFELLGLQAGTQAYSFRTSLGLRQGKNVWAAFHPPRTSGTEAIVLAASWESLGFVGDYAEGIESLNQPTEEYEGRDKTPRLKNLRGIASLLSLAEYLRGTEHYAKTIIFVISDHHLDGMQAFLASYHGVTQTNLVAQELEGLQKGVIWTALCIDYPGHSFSHLSVYFEGTNGRLPNQDLINAVSNIAQFKHSIPVRLYQQSFELAQPAEDATGLVAWVRRLTAVQDFLRAGSNLAEHWRWAGSGRASGVHGVFLQYRIDAITVFASPALGPHGFHSLGRLIESSLRAVNNLLERLHASLFFYLYLRPGRTHKVGSYLPAAVLIGAGLSILALSRWPRIANFDSDRMRGPRPVLPAITLIVVTHVVSAGFLATGTQLGWFEAMLSPYTSSFAGLGAAVGGLLISISLPRLSSATLAPPTKLRLRVAELARIVSCLTHLLIGAAISTLSMLNFPQAIVLGVVTIPPLLLASPTPLDMTLTAAPNRSSWRKSISAVVLATFSPIGVAGILSTVLGDDVARLEVRSLIEEWELLGDWCWIGVWLVWWATWLQTLLASELCLGS